MNNVEQPEGRKSEDSSTELTQEPVHVYVGSEEYSKSVALGRLRKELKKQQRDAYQNRKPEDVYKVKRMVAVYDSAGDIRLEEREVETTALEEELSASIAAIKLDMNSQSGAVGNQYAHIYGALDGGIGSRQEVKVDSDQRQMLNIDHLNKLKMERIRTFNHTYGAMNSRDAIEKGQTLPSGDYIYTHQQGDQEKGILGIEGVELKCHRPSDNDVPMSEALTSYCRRLASSGLTADWEDPELTKTVLDEHRRNLAITGAAIPTSKSLFNSSNSPSTEHVHEFPEPQRSKRYYSRIAHDEPPFITGRTKTLFSSKPKNDLMSRLIRRRLNK